MEKMTSGVLCWRCMAKNRAVVVLPKKGRGYKLAHGGSTDDDYITVRACAFSGDNYDTVRIEVGGQSFFGVGGHLFLSKREAGRLLAGLVRSVGLIGDNKVKKSKRPTP